MRTLNEISDNALGIATIAGLAAAIVAKHLHDKKKKRLEDYGIKDKKDEEIKTDTSIGLADITTAAEDELLARRSR